MPNNSHNHQKLADWQRKQAAGVVTASLQSAKHQGVPEYEIRTLVKTSLGFQPSEWDFRKIMFKAHYKSEKGTFFAIGYGPQRPKKEKKPKSEPAQVTKDDDQTLTFEGKEYDVTIKGPGVSFKSIVKKVIVVIGGILN